MRWRHRPRARHGLPEALLLGTLFWAIAPPVLGEPASLDWCAPVATRPLVRWADRERCEPYWSPERLAREADLVLLGGGELASAGDASAPLDTCLGPLTRGVQADWIDAVRARAERSGRAPRFGLMTRFDLVGARRAGQSGFRSEFLLHTSQPFDQAESFFSKDHSSSCREGCQLSIREGEHLSPLLARVEAAGGAGAWRRIVYYVGRVATAPRRIPLTHAVADLTNLEYRAWRALGAHRALAEGRFDAVYLSHKLHQYRPRQGRAAEHWLGGRRFPDVAALVETGETVFSAPPTGYGYPEYVAGWSGMAAQLRLAGVPYVVMLPVALWAGDTYDDPSTRDQDEGAQLRAAAEAARVVLLERAGHAHYEAARSVLVASNVEVIGIDTSCGRPGALYGAPTKK